MIELFLDNRGDILSGLWTTIWMVASGFAVGAVIGVAFGVARGKAIMPVRILIGAYVEIIRNTPFLIQASLLFAVTGVLRIRVDPETLGATAVALYTAAYMTEITRAALQSVPAGQSEAARALGLKRWQVFRLVVLPQLLPFAVPASANLFATVTKESSFLAALSVAELTFSGQVAISKTFAVFEVWAVIGVLYLCLILGIIAAANWLERRSGWIAAGQ